MKCFSVFFVEPNIPQTFCPFQQKTGPRSKEAPARQKRQSGRSTVSPLSMNGAGCVMQEEAAVQTWFFSTRSISLLAYGCSSPNRVLVAQHLGAADLHFHPRAFIAFKDGFCGGFDLWSLSLWGGWGKVSEQECQSISHCSVCPIKEPCSPRAQHLPHLLSISLYSSLLNLK